MLFRRAATLLLALIFVTPIAAAANFPGWTRTYNADHIMITSPEDANGMVSFMFTTTNEPEKEDPRVAFPKMVDSALASLDANMRLTHRSGMRAEGGMIVEAFKVGVPGGEVDLLVFAYDTGNNYWGAGMLAYVSAIADADPRVNHALDFIATAARTKYRMADARAFDRTAPQAQSLTAYTATKTAPTPPPKPATPARNRNKAANAASAARSGASASPTGANPPASAPTA